MFPDDTWTKTDMMLAELVDTLHWLQWVKTRDGQRGRGMPPRVPRPGTCHEAAAGVETETGTFVGGQSTSGTDTMTRTVPKR